MAELNLPAPYEGAKVDYLHDQSARPEAPKAEKSDRGRYLFAILLGVVATAALVALAFEARSSWESHRDWVVPAVAPLLAIGGVAFAYLVIRGELTAVVTGFMFAFVTLLLEILNRYRGSETDGSDVGRDVLSSLAGVGVALTVLVLVIAMIMVEVRHPQRPPSQGA